MALDHSCSGHTVRNIFLHSSSSHTHACTRLTQHVLTSVTRAEVSSNPFFPRAIQAGTVHSVLPFSSSWTLRTDFGTRPPSIRGFGTPAELNSAWEAVQETGLGLPRRLGSSPGSGAHGPCGLSRALSLPRFLHLYRGDGDFAHLVAPL